MDLHRRDEALAGSAFTRVSKSTTLWPPLHLPEAGDGITIALSYMVAKSIREGRLVPILLSWCPPTFPVQLVYPESRLVAPKVRAFIDYAAPKVRAALGELKTR